MEQLFCFMTVFKNYHNSIVKWRKMYIELGIQPQLSHSRVGGFKN